MQLIRLSSTEIVNVSQIEKAERHNAGVDISIKGERTLRVFFGEDAERIWRDLNLASDGRWCDFCGSVIPMEKHHPHCYIEKLLQDDAGSVPMTSDPEGRAYMEY